MLKRLLLIVGMVGMWGTADLQAQVRFGGQVGYANDADLGIGGRVQVGLPVERLAFIGSFDWYFPSDVVGVSINYWEINANVKYGIPVNNALFGPYVGSGLNFAHASVSTQGFSASDSDLGLNLMAGTSFNTGRYHPFAELRFEIGGGEQVILAGGLMF
jgi:opacity protein-like surface antigen